MILGDNRQLDEGQKRAALEKVAERGFSCGSCGSEDFDVGGALYLGFLFLSEDRDAYMVALTCKRPGCGAPRTGIKLHETEFMR